MRASFSKYVVHVADTSEPPFCHECQKIMADGDVAAINLEGGVCLCETCCEEKKLEIKTMDDKKVWVVMYDHKYGTDAYPCADEATALTVAANTIVNNMDETYGSAKDRNAVRKLLRAGEYQKAIDEFEAIQESKIHPESIRIIEEDYTPTPESVDVDEDEEDDGEEGEDEDEEDDE